MNIRFDKKQALWTSARGAVALFSLVVAAASAQAQNTVFLETFGDSSARVSSPYVPRTATGNVGYYSPRDSGSVPDGTYTVMRPQNVTGTVDNYWANLPRDHTDEAAGQGGTTGALMVLNAGSGLDQFYRRNFDVQPGHSYRVSVWRYVVNGDLSSGNGDKAGPISWSLQVQNVNSGEVLVQSGDIANKAWRSWEESRYDFTVSPTCATGAAGIQATLALRNRSPITNGNDFYIDDISVTRLTYDPALPQGCPTERSLVTAHNDTASTSAGTAVNIDVRNNDGNTRPDTSLAPPRVVTPPASGTATVNADGTVRYTPAPGFTGTVSFDYDVCNTYAPVPDCDTATVTVYVGPVPDLAIDLRGLTGTGSTGAPYTGSFACTNQGSATATAGTRCSVAALPPGLRTGACTLSPTNIPWAAGDAVPVGQTVTCEVVGTPTGSGTTIVSGRTGATGDTNAANDTDTRPIVIAAAPVLAVDLSRLPTAGTVGVPYTGSFTCTNSGTASAASGTCAVSQLPPGVSMGACTVSPGNATWSAGNAIPAGQTVTCQVAGTPTTPGTAPTTGTAGGSPTSHPIAIAGVPNVTIDLTQLPTTGTVGVPYTGSFTCTNSGTASAASGTCAVSQLPPGVSTGACTFSPGNAAWSAGDPIAVGQTVTCQVAGTPSAPGVSPVEGTAGGPPTTHPVAIAGVPNLSIDLGGIPPNGTVGTPYTGSFSCTNTGSADAIGARCTAGPLPAGVATGACTISPGAAPWASPGTIPQGATVTCPVTGTPTTVGLTTVDGQAATGGATASGTQAVAISAPVPVPTLGQWGWALISALLASLGWAGLRHRSR